MKISKQARREAKELFRAAQVNGVLDDNRFRQAMSELLARKPRGYPAILSHLQHLVKLDIARRTARIESVVPLDAHVEGTVKAALTQRYGQGLQFSFGTNPALIGGMRVQVGSDVFDGSVRARLTELEDNFQAA
jgi:F-type H+-transporting ATPase subunit delta